MALLHPSGASSPSSLVIPLPTLYRTWGAWLKGARASTNATQKKLIEDTSLPYFRARHVSVLNWRMYSSMERDERTPLFEELEPLYRTFAEGYILSFSDIERDLYLKRARERIETNLKKPQHIKPEQWDQLAEALAGIGASKRDRIYLLDLDEQKHSSSEEKESRRSKALAEALRTDTSHLLEREEWVQKMLTYPVMTPQKKLVTIQGHQGTGKSHALTLLTQRLAQQTDLYLIPYRFENGEGKTPEDHLSVFLATILADLIQITTIDEAKQRPLEERIDQVLTAIKQRSEQGQRVILLLDDVQEIFPSAIEWSPAWEQFFQSFVREPHTATIYIATRTWPEWIDRRRTYLEETDLPELSPEAGIAMWQRFGFTDVPDDLIQQVVIRWGSNPHLIEMRASHLKQRPWAFAWNKRGEVKSRFVESENTTRLKNLLEQDSIFNPKTDIEAQKILQQVISSRLSHPALRILECLAISPLGLPFSLLDEEFPRVYVAFDELTRASLTDLGMAAANRAAVAPLIREAQLQTLLNDGRYSAVESRVTDLYAHWLHDVQDFRDDAEKSALIAEMVVRYIRSRQLLKAAELFISFGWLCTLFGYMERIRRVFEATIKADRGKEEDIKHEAGRLILKHRIAVHSGQKIERDERDQIYQDIYKKVVEGEVILQPHSELEVLHNMLLFYSRKGQLVEASSMFDQTFERLQQSGQMTPEVYALFLFDRGRLMSYRADKEFQLEASLNFTEASVNCIKDSITNWRLCLKNALPLQEHYVQFKLARALNDLACDLRTLKQYTDAQQAIEESIKLKKSSGALPHSIAVALSECSQILAAQGKIREALSVNEEAMKILEQSISDGNDMHKPELGMILKERASIFLLQARLAEAKSLLEQAVELIRDKPLRQKDKEKAKAQIEEIQLITASSSQSYQLDRRWFSHFSDIIEFNDTQWLTQAGPFTEEEKVEWERLSSKKDEQSHSQMSKLIAQSRKREFTCSLEENREPISHYPHLPLDDVRNRINGLTTLCQEIGVQESNMVVRRLYLDAINEHLAFLRLCEAIALQDQTTAMQCNLQLYGKPSEREFKIALQQLCSMLLEARTHKLAGSVALEALTQLKEWGISPQEIVAEDLFIPIFEPILQRANHKLLPSEKRTFSTTTVCKFFQDILVMYGEDNWNVYVNSARDHTTVDPNIRELILPEKDFSVQKVRQLLAEEIEVHSYRAIAGRNSPLALLGSGLANHLSADEGLAYHYVQSVNSSVYGKYEEKRWNATLTTGFVSGVLTHPLSFPELRNFLGKMFLVSELLDDATWEDAFEFSRQAAWRRCSRVFRGAGCVSLKDRVYLQGYLEISNYLAHGGEEQRLYVGCVGIDHLEDMAELGILLPNYPHQHLALATDLAERLASYES